MSAAQLRAPARRPAPVPSPRELPPPSRAPGALWERIAFRPPSPAAPRETLPIGAPGDPLEREADRVADAVLGSDGGRAAALPSARAGRELKRCPGCPPGGRCARCEAEAHSRGEPPLVQRSATGGPAVAGPETLAYVAGLAGRGAPLSPETRSWLEPRFGRDFGDVRVHADPEAARAAQAVSARAFTVGRDVVFGAGELAPRSADGRRLLAHELAHVVQQGAASPLPGASPAAPAPARAPRMLSREEKKEGGNGGAAASLFESGTICGRASRQVRGFPATHITQVDVDLGNLSSGLSITWANPSGLSLPTGPFQICPGAGLCCDDCDDTTTSQRANHLCTPKGTFPVHSKACVLGDAAWALNPTFFSRPGIAIHNGAGHLQSFPASHGCVRTELEASKLVHDNSIRTDSRSAADRESGTADPRTQIHVFGTWAGTHCYRREADQTPVARSAACSSAPATPPARRRSGASDAPRSEAGAAAPAAGEVADARDADAVNEPPA